MVGSRDGSLARDRERRNPREREGMRFVILGKRRGLLDILRIEKVVVRIGEMEINGNETI